MLSMSFLTQPREGMEFINFQNDDFYNKLSGFLEDNINDQQVLSKDSIPGIKAIIEEFTGFSNLTIELTDSGNLSVDVGYISPNNILNSDLVDQLLKTTETTLYKWFVQNKDKVFKGGVDYRSGKVTGAFCKLPITMQINKDLGKTFPSDKIEKYRIPIHGVLTGAIAHEMGHCYGGCALMTSVATDNFVAKAAIRFYKGKPTPNERVMVLQDMNAVLDLKPGKVTELQEIAQNESEITAIMYFNKLVTQRNTSRALSLGVERMSSEVIADVYAIRMGCDKAVIAAIGALVDHGCIVTVLNSLLAAVWYTVFTTALLFPQLILMAAAGAAGGVLLLGGIFIFTLSFILAYFSGGYSDVYNAGHRRFEDAVRQMIAKLKEVKDMPATDKAILLKDIEKLLGINSTLKPWYENTFIRRMVGWMFNGSDFKKQEHEHFTQALANSEMTVLAERLKTLA